MHKKKLVAAGLVAALTLGIAGAAFAYFTATGSGTGNATTGTATPWTVTAAPATGMMFPGGGVSTVPFTVTNPNAGALTYTTLTAAVPADTDGNITSGGAPVVGCLASWFTAVAGTPSVGPGSIAGGGSFTVAVAVMMGDSGTNQDPCQGATPDVTLTVS